MNETTRITIQERGINGDQESLKSPDNTLKADENPYPLYTCQHNHNIIGRNILILKFYERKSYRTL